MESWTHRLRVQGASLDTDASSTTRLAKRPASSQTTGAAFEDFGSDFGQRASRSRTSSRAPSIEPHASRKGKTIKFHDSDESSDDEIDFLSSSSRYGSETPKKPRKTKTSAPSIPASVTLAIDRHQADPNYKAINLKHMKIPKRSSAATSSTSQTPENSQEPHPQASLAGPSSSFRSVPASRSSSRIAASTERDKENRRKKLPLREHSPNQDKPRACRTVTPPCENVELRRGKELAKDNDMNRTPRPSRPAPRPVNKGTRSSLGKSQTVPDLGAHSSQDKSQPLSRSQTAQEPIQISSDSSDHDSDDIKTSFPRKKSTTRARKTEKSDPFAALSPLSSQHDKKSTLEDRHARRAKVKGSGKGKERASPIGDLSPLSSPIQHIGKARLANFPALSPLTSPASRQTSSPPHLKIKASAAQRRSAITSSSEDDDLPQRELRPFPMETQVLANLQKISPLSKRVTPGSDDEHGGNTYRKRSRDNCNKFVLNDGSDSDDDMFLDPNIDPKTLCPWCDEPLPEEPTPQLRSLIVAAKRVSRPDDRMSNPLGLRAPLAAFVGVCQRHRFERDWIPRARSKGWPTKIAWDKLADRVMRIQGALKALIDDVDEDFTDTSNVARASSSRRPRKENEFWQEVVQNVRQQGSRQAAGVRGQFLNFNKAQPGYYGELGYVIMHQTLCDLFPPAKFHPDATLPLTPSDFIARVLVPETAVRLIIEDLALPRDKAIETLRESVEYGVAMFPADEGEAELVGVASPKGRKLGAGEQMFLERARARRKELEEEERREEEEARKAKADAKRKAKAHALTVEPHEPKTKPRPRPKPRAPGAQTDGESAGPASSSPQSSGRKRKSSGRNSGPPAGAVVIELSSDTAESNAAGPTKRRRKTREVQSDVQVDHIRTSPVPADDATPKAVKVKPQPRPRPKPRAVSVSRQNDESGPEAEAEDVDLPPPSSSQSLPFVAWGKKGTVTVHKSESHLSRPSSNTRTRRFDTVPAPGVSSLTKAGGSGAKAPLQVARERRQQQAQEAMSQPSTSTSAARSKRTDDWIPNTRTGNDVFEWTTDDDDVRPSGLGDGVTTAGAMGKARFGKQSQKSGGGSWDWLLNDDSQSRPASPSALEYDYSFME